MSVTIGLVANVYNEANSLPGWLETHLPFFDDVRVYHAGPDGEGSTDGTMDILWKWNVPFLIGSIDDGFGATRTRAIRSSPCDWVMLLDADERFFPVHRMMTCGGESTPHSEVDTILQSYDFHDLKTTLPNWENIKRLGNKLRVDIGDTYNQGARLREILAQADESVDAVVTIRRHWHDMSFRRPTQNWHTDPDWQSRIVRNCDRVRFDPCTRMHERLVGVRSNIHADMVRGPFFDHFHFTFKRMEVEQRAHDVAIYNAIHAGAKPPTQNQFNEVLMS